MVIVDAVIAALILGAAVWGYRRGMTSGGLALIGFGIGAVLGSRLAPLALDGGLRDPFAPVLALPAALLLGALVAVVLERFGFRLRRSIRRRGTVDHVGGAVLAGCLGLVLTWSLGAAAARIDGLRDSVRDSEIVAQLNAVLPPPGPLLKAAEIKRDPLPVIRGPRASVGPVDETITRDPQVRAAAKSVVKIFSQGCGGTAQGSGWIGRDGLVVTNAHVVAGGENIRVQPEGKGVEHGAEAVWIDRKGDIAVLRSSGVSGLPALRVERKPGVDVLAATLGFPLDGPYTVAAARVGARASRLRLEQGGLRPRSAITLRADLAPGNSGGPVVDERGRVVTMVYASRAGGSFAYGVPATTIRRALRRAREPVDTGRCGA